MNSPEITNEEKAHSPALFTIRTAELAVGLALGIGALILCWSNYQLGAGWNSYGPDAGYFPFRLSVVVFIASCFVLFHAIRNNDRTPFIEKAQARMVGVILIPLLIYVFVISYLGIYVASVIFIAAFMRFLGKFPWWKSALVSIGLMVAFFYVFEIQFGVPLPKGPLENWLGY
jgi:hypothetical protein